MTDLSNNPRPTKRMIEFLQWANIAGPHRVWPLEWSVMHRKARQLGYIERRREDGRLMGLAAWCISDKGRSIIGV